MMLSRVQKKQMKMAYYNQFSWRACERYSDSRDLQENLRILYAIEKSKLNASLSIKLTQLGLDIQKELCLSYVNKIVSDASHKNIFVWIDMVLTTHKIPLISILI